MFEGDIGHRHSILNLSREAKSISDLMVFQHKTLVAVMSKSLLSASKFIRIRSVLKRKVTQKVAARFSVQLYSACQEVIKKKGAASRGQALDVIVWLDSPTRLVC